MHQHVLIDVKICLSFFLGLNQLNIYPFRFSLHGGSTINRQVLSSAEEISLMCSCCAVPTSCTLTGRMLCLRKLTEMLVSAKFSQKIYKRIFGLWHTCFASCLARFEDFRNGARNKVTPLDAIYYIQGTPSVHCLTPSGITGRLAISELNLWKGFEVDILLDCFLFKVIKSGLRCVTLL